MGYYLFSCVFVLENWGFWPFGNSLSLLLLLLSLSLRLVFLFGEALRALTTTTTVTIVIQFREEVVQGLFVGWVCVWGWGEGRKEGRKRGGGGAGGEMGIWGFEARRSHFGEETGIGWLLDCQTSVCFFSSSLLCICLYLEPWTNITNNPSRKIQDVLQYVYVLELYYVQNWAELACPLMMARRTKANLDCAILPPCTQKQSIKLPTVMKNLFAPLICYVQLGVFFWFCWRILMHLIRRVYYWSCATNCEARRNDLWGSPPWPNFWSSLQRAFCH